MKTITKKGIDALREEFPALTTLMMSMIIAGDGNKCVISAMYAVSECGGWGLTYNFIEDQIMSYISTSRGLSLYDTEDYISKNGLTDNETHQVMSLIFGGVGATCGSATAGECNFVAFNTGEVAADGKPIYHAGTLNFIDEKNGTAAITDGDGNTHVIYLHDKNGNSNIGIMYDIPKNTDGACGSGNSGSGSTCGSGSGSTCGSGNTCGSGSGWY